MWGKRIWNRFTKLFTIRRVNMFSVGQTYLKLFKRASLSSKVNETWNNGHKGFYISLKHRWQKVNKKYLLRNHKNHLDFVRVSLYLKTQIHASKITEMFIGPPFYVKCNYLAKNWNIVFCAVNLNLKFKIKKTSKLWSYSSSNLKHITKIKKKITLFSGFNKNSNNGHRGLYIGLKQPLAKVKQEINIEEA